MILFLVIIIASVVPGVNEKVLVCFKSYKQSNNQLSRY